MVGKISIPRDKEQNDPLNCFLFTLTILEDDMGLAEINMLRNALNNEIKKQTEPSESIQHIQNLFYLLVL